MVILFLPLNFQQLSNRAQDVDLCSENRTQYYFLQVLRTQKMVFDRNVCATKSIIYFWASNRISYAKVGFVPYFDEEVILYGK